MAATVTNLKNIERARKTHSYRENNKSYADATKGLRHAQGGTCSVLKEGDKKIMIIDDNGMDEKQQLLGSCLVLTEWSSQGTVLEVVRWGCRAWKALGPISFYPHGEDVVLVNCPSKDIANFILKQGTVSFKGGRIKLCSWETWHNQTKNNLAAREEGWLWIEGLPIHMRVKCLFQKIGECFGGLLELKGEDNLWLEQDLLIKVGIAKGVMEELTVEGRGVRWEIRLMEIISGVKPAAAQSPSHPMDGGCAVAKGGATSSRLASKEGGSKVNKGGTRQQLLSR